MPDSSSPTATNGTPDLTGVSQGTSQTPQAERPPEATNPEAEALIREIDPSIFKMAVMIPYGGRGPGGNECSDFWTHHWDKHITGTGSPNTSKEIVEFLAAVESGDAQLTKAAARTGGGLISLFKYKGQQWLMFIGEGLRPSIYRPTGNIQQAIRRALGRNTLQQPSNKLKAANQTAARCFRESAPEYVTIRVEETVEISVSEFNGVFDVNAPIIPVGGSTATPPVRIPIPVGSYGMEIPISGTPPAWGIPSNYTYSAEHAAYLWTPEGGYGLTPMEMAETVIFGGGVVVIVAIIVIAPEVTIPIVVIGAPDAAALISAFAR